MKTSKIIISLFISFFISLPLAAKQRDMNVLLITVDTLRYDRVSFYSAEHVKTPNIDRLAAESQVFRRAFAHNPVTLPSHTNILTGTTPRYHGISDNPGFKLEERFLTLAEFLKERGYSTGAFIASFPLDSRFGLDQGFDIYNDNYGVQRLYQLYFAERPAEEVIEPARDWIKAQKEKWFCWIHLFDPHEPYAPPAPYDTLYKDDLYSGEAAYVDAQLGILFDELRDNRASRETLIVLTADHGEAMGEKGEMTHSYFAYNNTIHIPLIFYLPGSEGRICDENVCHADIFPTIGDALGFDLPPHLQGESLLPVLDGKRRRNREIYFESLTPYLTAGWAPLTGFIRDNLKYVDLPIKEVYDLEKDMQEDVNLVNDHDVRLLEKELKSLKKRMQGKGVSQNLDWIEQDTVNKMKSLGYISTGASKKQKKYSQKDDLKVLLPVQRKILVSTRLFRAGRMDEAENSLKEAIEQRPDYVPAYSQLSNLYYSTNRKDQAVGILESGLKENRKNLHLQSRLGLMLVEVQQYDQAIRLLNECIKREGNNPDYFNYLGVAYQKNGKFDLALENYKKAIQLDKNNAVVYNNIGSVQLMYFLRTRDLKYYHLAVDSFNNALAFNPYLQAAINGKQAAEKFKSQLEKRLNANDLSNRR